jgi:hypothetical protein
VLCLVLLALIAVYIVLHARFPEPGQAQSTALVIVIDQARTQTQSADAQADLTQDQGLAASLAQAETLWGEIRTDGLQGVSEKDVQFVSDLLAEGGRTILAQNQAAAASNLQAVAGLLNAARVRGYFWNQVPLRYLEVIFWALAGVLVNLILTSGSYLRWRRFYREGIILHVAQIVAVPVLALIFVFLLSLVKINLMLVGTAQATLDLSDPRVLVAISFIIGSRPWNLWNFIQERAALITGAAQS